MGYLLSLLVVVCLDAVRRMHVNRRFADLEFDIHSLRDSQGDVMALRGLLTRLERRVALLERRAPVMETPAEAPQAEDAPAETRTEPAAARVGDSEAAYPLHDAGHGGFSWAQPDAIREEPRLDIPSMPIADGVADAPVAAQTSTDDGPASPQAADERLPQGASPRDWESLIGGDWLNKLGVLVLVVGISLFVGYSLTHVGPAGRVALGFSASAGLLAAGVLSERRQRYVLFGRGLIGGGWAGIYFTTYAMHALDAARVVTNPVVATVALASVAGAIIVHSLRYRSQVVTGLAYVIGFVTLVLTPATTFGLLATLPLAASLIVAAQRYEWTGTVVVGLIASYGTLLVRTGADPAVDFGPYVREQIVVALYWLMFEGFDIASERRDPGRARYLLFPLNAVGLIGVSLLKWPTVGVSTVSLLCAIGTGAYLASAIARALLTTGHRQADPDGAGLAIGDRTYQAPATIAAALAVPAIALRFTGLQIDVAFLLAAGFLFFTGLRFGDRYLRWLSAALMVIPVVKVAVLDPLMGDIAIAGVTVLRSTPLTLLTAAVLYLFRGMARDRGDEGIAPEAWYRFAAAALLAATVGREVPREYLGPCWMALGFALAEAGWRVRLSEMRLHGCLTGVLSLVAIAALNLISLEKGVWIPLTLQTLLASAWSLRLAAVPADDLADEDRVWRHGCATAAIVCATAVIWTLTPAAFVSIAWLIFAAALFEVGLGERLAGARMLAYPVAVLAAMNAVSYGVFTTGVHHLITLAANGLLFKALALRLHYLGPQEFHDEERTTAGVCASWLGMGFLTSLLWYAAPHGWIGVSWGVAVLLLLVLGRTLDSEQLRWQGFVLAALTFAGQMAGRHDAIGAIAGVPERIVTAGVVAALFYAAQALVYPAASSRHDIDAVAPAAFSVMATMLLAALLYREASSGVLTIAWAIQGIVLLAAGFITGDRTLRRSSLALLAICTLKVFAYDFRELDTLSRIFSFIVLGLVLLLASWAYARYRERLRRYL